MSKQTQKNSSKKNNPPKNHNFSFTAIKELLLHQQKKVESEIKNIEKDDPVLSSALAESSEPGTDSWMADVHSRTTAAKHGLQDILERTRKALAAIQHGKYGKCEKCGKAIEADRLKAMPTAVLCISCSKKYSKK